MAEANTFDIKAARAALGLTQEALAREIGTSVNTVRDWEQNRRNTTPVARRLIERMVADKLAEKAAA